ncbi:hypothetical protein tb265_26010 [Gemmatimonadetes bacterium T265]|nr:hypothetical protein tb265_26010 [Gemmatimonadetes bacterium T265]
MEPFPEWYVAHLTEIFALAKPALKVAGSVWVNLGDTYFARWASIRDRGRQGLGGNPRERRRVPMGGYCQEKQLLLIPARFAIAMQDARWILRNDLIWHKPNVPPRPETDLLRLAHEHFFHFVHRLTQGSAKYHKYYYDLPAVETAGTDVTTCYVRSGQDGHTATFPEALITPRILSSCPPGGTVLDPFAGTGRALAVAVRQGRHAIGLEVSTSFAAAARGQLDAELARGADASGNARMAGPSTAPRRTTSPSGSDTASNPHVTATGASIADQRARRCLFLSHVKHESRECIKGPAAKGVCTVSSSSNGPRQDGVAYPYRVFDAGVLRPDSPGDAMPDGKVPAWIYVFDIDAAAERTPNPLVVRKVIGATAGALNHYALSEAPRHAAAALLSDVGIYDILRRRPRAYWPGQAFAIDPERHGVQGATPGDATLT